MTKKELITQCTSLVKKVARKQLTIGDLRKKKGVPLTACAECKVKDQAYEERYRAAIDESFDAEEKYTGQIEVLENQNEGLKKDIVKLENEQTRLENEAKIEAVRMKAVEDQLAKAEAQCVFYQGRLFPVQTPAHGATHGASVSMAGGGNRGLSPAAFFASPPE